MTLDTVKSSRGCPETPPAGRRIDGGPDLWGVDKDNADARESYHVRRDALRPQSSEVGAWGGPPATGFFEGQGVGMDSASELSETMPAARYASDSERGHMRWPVRVTKTWRCGDMDA